MEKLEADIVIVGTGASGLFAALHVPSDKKVIMLTKSDAENSDSFLAQGGICVLRDKNDFDSFMEDTMKAGITKIVRNLLKLLSIQAVTLLMN